MSDEDEDQVQGEGGQASDSDSSDDIPLSGIARNLRTNYYYGKNRYKWAKTSPSARVRTLQHNIMTWLDNCFSSIELVDELSSRKLTYVSTVKKQTRNTDRISAK